MGLSRGGQVTFLRCYTFDVQFRPSKNIEGANTNVARY